MRGDEFAVARQPLPDSDNDPSGAAFAEQDGALPPMANQFTSINPTERFRQTPRRDSSRQHTAVMPPLRPGQRYGGAPVEWEEPLAPPPHTETYTPYDDTLMPAFSQDPAMAREELRRYQQNYWAELKGAPENQMNGPAATDPAMGGDAAQFPAYLQKTQMPPSLEDWTARDGWSSTLPWTERADWPPQEQWIDPAPPLAGEWEQAEEYTQFQEDPWEMDSPVVESGFAAEDWEPPLSQRPPYAPPAEIRISKRKLVTGIVTAIILMFCAVQIGRVVLVMMENEEEMKNVRAEYYALTGNDLAGDAARVELLPEGQTFAPTAFPETPPPAPVATARGNGQGAGGSGETASEPTDQPRVRLKSYADNPLGNTREEFLSPLQENPDTVGKLVISGVVEEMVVQRNNTYYLNHNSRGTLGPMGAVFVDEGYSIKKPPENLLLRGQSSFSGKLFEPLAQYVTGGVEFFRQHAVFQFNTLYEEGEYVLLAVIVAASDPSSPDYFNYAAYSSFQTDSQMESYVTSARQHSIYEIPVEVQASDRLLTLSTLGEGGDKQCLVLLARKLRPGETASSFTVALRSVRLR